MSQVSRWFRLLIALHPREFRDRFGEELFDAVAQSMRGRRIFGSQWRFLSRDLIRSMARERMAAFSASPIPIEAEHHLLTNGPRMGNLLQDLRYAIRSLSRVPGFTATVIISLALGIGANTLVYSLVDGLVLRPFPYPEANRLVTVGVRYADSDERTYIESLSAPEFEDIRGTSRTLERFFAFDLGNRNISGGDQPERVFTAFVWGDPFATIGLRPHLGRGFTANETTSNESSAAILSHRIWVSRFGADPGIIGKSVQVNGVPRDVIGIMPPSILIMGADLWLPMGVQPAVIPRQARQFAIVARMRAGTTMTEVQTDLATVASTVARTWEGQHPEYKQWSLAASTWGDVMSEPMRPASLVMLGTVVFVLLLACANIASLMLARASARQRELSLRAALGARTPRLARQLVTESLLLSFAGGALGVVIAVVLLGPSTSLFPDRVAALGLKPALSPAVLFGTLAITVFVGLITSVAPVVQLARQRGLSGLVSAGRVHGGRGDRRVRQGFTIAQVAFALVLVSGATVMLRSMNRLQSVTPGIDAEHLLTMRLSLPQEKYKRAEIGPFFEMLSDRLAAIPGVRNAAAVTQFPPMNGFDARVTTDDAMAGGRVGSAMMADVTNATEDFVATQGLRLMTGRTFASTDAEGAPRVAILNAIAASRFLTGNALGKRIGLVVEDDTVWHEVVGVVSDARNHGLDSPAEPEVFVPVRQQAVAWNNQLFLMVRTQGEPFTVLPAVRETIRSIDAQQPVYAIRTVSGAFAESVASRRAASILLAAFAGIAVLLAAVGIYGILSYLVNARTHEIGVRMALGANERSVVGLVLQETAWLLGIGCLIGGAGVLAMRRVISGIAFEVQATEPLTVAMTLFVLSGTALVAGFVPTRRAVRVTPVEALRSD
jgi:putative ABC transport system permease protein